MSSVEDIVNTGHKIAHLAGITPKQKKALPFKEVPMPIIQRLESQDYDTWRDIEECESDLSEPDPCPDYL